MMGTLFVFNKQIADFQAKPPGDFSQGIGGVHGHIAIPISTPLRPLQAGLNAELIDILNAILLSNLTQRTYQRLFWCTHIYIL